MEIFVPLGGTNGTTSWNNRITYTLSQEAMYVNGFSLPFCVL